MPIVAAALLEEGDYFKLKYTTVVWNTERYLKNIVYGKTVRTTRRIRGSASSLKFHIRIRYNQFHLKSIDPQIISTRVQKH